MSIPPKFLMSIAKAAHLSEEGSGTMTIVIWRPYAHLEKELRSAFKGVEDVKVILDRRYEERRKSKEPVTVECRQADRRRSKAELIEIVIST